jgi:hypothetical protein
MRKPRLAALGVEALSLEIIASHVNLRQCLELLRGVCAFSEMGFGWSGRNV